MKTDYQVQKDVMEQLNWEPILNASEIGVAVKNGVVTLSGMVDTYTKKMVAEKAAKKVSGVKAIALDLHVGVSPIFKKSDSEIAEAVLNALKLHMAVQDENIKIKVENGIVTLEGTVEWEYQRKAAKDAIENLPGVRDVLNYITIKALITASDIEKKITAAFQRNAAFDAEKIKVETVGSKVILVGIVRSLAEKDDAEDAVWAAPGVMAIENKLIVEEDLLVF